MCYTVAMETFIKGVKIYTVRFEKCSRFSHRVWNWRVRPFMFEYREGPFKLSSLFFFFHSSILVVDVHLQILLRFRSRLDLQMRTVSITSSVFYPNWILNLIAVSKTFNGHIPFCSRVPFSKFESCFLNFDFVRQWISGFVLEYEVFSNFDLNCSVCACFNFEILCMILKL